MSSADQLLSLIRETTQIELSKEDSTSICQIESVNPDKTVNIFILPDIRTRITNIYNNSNSELLAGDTAVLYKIKNQISNSFILAKCGPPREKSQAAVQSSAGGDVIMSGGAGGGTVVIDDKTYIKNFTKDDFTRVGVAQRYFIQILQKEHGLTNPYVNKMVVDYKKDNEETTNFQTPVVVQSKTLSTGTIKIYVTIDLSEYTEYSGKIYLIGE